MLYLVSFYADSLGYSKKSWMEPNAFLFYRENEKFWYKHKIVHLSVCDDFFALWSMKE